MKIGTAYDKIAEPEMPSLNYELVTIEEHKAREKEIALRGATLPFENYAEIMGYKKPEVQVHGGDIYRLVEKHFKIVAVHSAVKSVPEIARAGEVGDLVYQANVNDILDFSKALIQLAKIP